MEQLIIPGIGPRIEEQRGIQSSRVFTRYSRTIYGTTYLFVCHRSAVYVNQPAGIEVLRREPDGAVTPVRTFGAPFPRSRF